MPHFSNRQVIQRLENIADLSQIRGDNHFKVLAYRKAAESIKNLGQDIYAVWQAGELKAVSGVGKAIHDKLDDWFSTGEMDFWQKLTAEIPETLIELLAVPGVGPKSAQLVWRELGVLTVADLKEAAESGRLNGLPGMGKKTQANILAGIEAHARRQSDRFLLGDAWSTAQTVLAHLQTLPEVLRIEPAGSLRRFAPTIGDLDFLVATHQPASVMEAFRTLPNVESVLLSGETKTSIRFNNGLQADLRCLEPARWGTALQYFTGSQAHNIKLRELAQKQGLSLSEYALKTEDGQEILCAEEATVYQKLGLAYVPPVLREDRGELAAAQNNSLPQVVQTSDIRGEVHCHSTWSDGKHSIEAMARAALERGYEYLAITDHSYSLGVANGLNEERLHQQRQEIETVRQKLPQLTLLQGIELEVRADGSLDFKDEVLAELDFVVASVHTSLNQNREALTKRALNALRNPYVRVLAHPTGRLLTRREEGNFDLEVLLQVAAETGTMMEINASPHRLDLDSVYVKRAIELGVTLIINCDAHHQNGFDDLKFGVATAQRGWATTAHIANTWPLADLLALKQLG
jgi:DNA polymerase (family 10)